MSRDGNDDAPRHCNDAAALGVKHYAAFIRRRTEQGKASSKTRLGPLPDLRKVMIQAHIRLKAIRKQDVTGVTWRARLVPKSIHVRSPALRMAWRRVCIGVYSFSRIRGKGLRSGVVITWRKEKVGTGHYTTTHAIADGGDVRERQHRPASAYST